VRCRLEGFQVAIDSSNSGFFPFVGQRAEDGTAIATNLMEKLGVRKVDLIAGAYVDLIKKRS